MGTTGGFASLRPHHTTRKTKTERGEAKAEKGVGEIEGPSHTPTGRRNFMYFHVFGVAWASGR